MSIAETIRRTLGAQGLSPEARPTATMRAPLELGALAATVTPETTADLDSADDATRTASGLPVLTRQEAGGTPRPGLTDLEVVGRLGAGGMGVVEVARQRLFDREVAVKRLHEGTTAGPAVDALLREAYLSGRLEHPNIVPVHQVGLDSDAGPLVVMKRIKGRPWDRMLAKRSDPTDGLERHLGIFLEVCQAVVYAHASGVIHRDIKPENVLVGDFGEVYLVDWGVAFDEATGPRNQGVAGTPAYMAPEMAMAELDRIDERSDVFLLGATLFEILAGTPLHTGDSALAALIHAAQNPPVRLPDGTPEALAEVVQRACATDMDARFQSVQDLEQSLRQWLARRPAVRLREAAAKRLDDLAAGLEANASLADLHDLYSQARFGFEQALELWPAYPAAREGLRTTFLTMARVELAHRNLAAADAHLEHVADVPEAVRDERAALVAEIEEQDGLASRLQALERDEDLEVGRRQRSLIGVSLMLFSVGALAIIAWKGLRISPALALAIGGVFGLVVVAWIAWMFHKGYDNAINRRLALVVAMLVGAILCNRAIAVIHGLDTAVMHATDALFMVAGAVLTAPYMRLMRYVLVPSLIGTGLMVWDLELAFPVFSATAVVYPVIIWLEWRDAGPARAVSSDE